MIVSTNKLDSIKPHRGFDMETYISKLDGDGREALVLQVTRANGEIIELPPAPALKQTSFAMLLDNWHQFEARHDDI